MRLRVRVQPGVPRNQVVGVTEGVLRVRIAAPPEKGKANRELVAFLAGVLGVGRGQVSLVGGATSRSKVLEVEGLGEEEVWQRLQAAAKG